MSKRAKPSTPLRAFAKRLILCLLLGAVLQYAVAAAFGLSGSHSTHDMEWAIDLREGRAVDVVVLRQCRSLGRDVLVGNTLTRRSDLLRKAIVSVDAALFPGEWVETGASMFSIDGSPPPRPAHVLPVWSRFNRFATDAAFDYYPDPVFVAGPCYEIASGWPWRCASYFAWEHFAGGQLVVREALVVSSPAFANGITPRAIPLAIYWPGTMANTLVYSTALLIPFGLMPWTRYHFRRRAGRCPTCNYDLRANTTGVCPECGHIIPQASATKS